MRVRDELRRELRKLGARAETRGPATGEDSGVGSLTGRELEIAQLATERKTNRRSRGAVPEREDGGIPPAEHLREAGRVLSGGGGPHRGAGGPRTGSGVAPRTRPPDADAARLRELGYEQELDRRLGGFDNVAMGFATISPVVGLYAVVFLGTAVAGPAWIWVLPVALAGQCLLLAVYSELAAEFPITGGAYQWTRRLMGGAYGWITGWVAMCAYAAANTTIAYLGAPWALTLLEIEATGQQPGPRAWSSWSCAHSWGCAASGCSGVW